MTTLLYATALAITLFMMYGLQTHPQAAFQTKMPYLRGLSPHSVIAELLWPRQM
jgi:hypothetical protein